MYMQKSIEQAIIARNQKLQQNFANQVCPAVYPWKTLLLETELTPAEFFLAAEQAEINTPKLTSEELDNLADLPFFSDAVFILRYLETEDLPDGVKFALGSFNGEVGCYYTLHKQSIAVLECDIVIPPRYDLFPAEIPLLDGLRSRAGIITYVREIPKGFSQTFSPHDLPFFSNLATEKHQRFPI